jgi:salicylate hydroxylase
MRIGIIGTGVAGSVLLEALQSAPGLLAEGFDRSAPGELEQGGTGLNLCPNALKALRLHLPARHAALRRASLEWRRWTTSLADGTPLSSLDLLEVAEEAGAKLRWSELYRVLREAVAQRTRHGHELTALEEDARGRLVPVFATAGGVVRHGAFDLLVAGDGRYSRLRALAAGEPVPQHANIGMSRLLVPDAADAPLDDYGQWFNGNARLLAYRLPDGAAYIAGAFPLGEDGVLTEAMRGPDWPARAYLPEGVPACAPVAWMVAAMTRLAGHMHWARVQVAPLERLALGGRVLFLGDAAHAMFPTLGQGATQAIEDGAVAGAVLRAGGGAAAIGAWRDGRVEFVRRFSEEATDSMFPGADATTLGRDKAGPAFRARLRRLYTDVPGSAEIAARPNGPETAPSAG